MMSEEKLVLYNRKRFSVILTRILTLLGIDMGEPFEFEMGSVILVIPDQYEWKKQCIHMYALLYEEMEKIQENQKILNKIYQNLQKVEQEVKKRSK